MGNRMSVTTLRYGYAETPLGQLHYADAGAGEPVVLLHQTPRSLDEFREVQPLLAGKRRAIAMDMYGFGMSAKPSAGPQTIEQYASGVIALADVLGLERFALVGHHTGMFVASEVAAAVPDRVTAAVLSAGEYADEEFRTETTRQMADGGYDENGMDLAVDVVTPLEDGEHLKQLWAKRHTIYPKGRPDLLDRFIRDALAPGVDPAEGHLACARYVMEERVGLVTAPLLFLAATEDPVSYPHTGKVAAAYPRAKSVQVVEIEGGRIPLMEQKAGEVVSAIDAFFDSVGI
ncbi:alpha/beta hydrolase [Streptomyces olivaceus]|uniref:alpha/beta fold hydrolase n=1 Tax=Streptomyces olivaceus TaxID=47716 RepID=UPI001CCC24A8|nr:alpha/beta hydrolase [Streptomyces olivaceus]MBZ6083662.1 alpha/beta hydrolase [Streptomyces olivaceus]